MESHGGFSMREYVSRMRSVDVVKCWPFDETTCEGSVQSLLPPITVKKFIWWVDCLHYLDLESSQNVGTLKKMKKKVLEENGESSSMRRDHASQIDAVEEEEAMGVTVKGKSSKSKAKAPKKRSILEIFAVAPPVETINSASEAEEKRRRRRKIKKHKEIILNKLKKAKKVINKIKKTKKENCSMMKPRYEEKSIENRKDNKSSICDRLLIRKKNPRLLQKDATKDDIFKNRAKTKCALHQEANFQVDPRGKRVADKHVTFVDKGTLLRRQRRKPSVEEFFEMQQCSASDTHDAQPPGSLGDDSTIVEINESRDVSNRIQNRGHLTTPRPSVDDTTSTLTKQYNKDNTFIGPVTFDIMKDGRMQHLSDIGSCETHLIPNNASPYAFSPLPCEAMANSSCSTSRIRIKDFGTPATRHLPVCFENHLKMCNEPLVTNFERRANKMHQAPLQSINFSNNAYRVDATFPHLSHVCLSQDGCEYAPEDFVRLPLNSQGGLSTPWSKSKVGSSETIKPNTAAAPLINNSLLRNDIISKDWFSLLPSEGSLREEAIGSIQSRLDMNKYRWRGRTRVDDRSESFVSSEDNQPLKALGSDQIRPTMRLMGKEFIVGGRGGFQEFEDRRILKDKKIMNQECEPSLSDITVNHTSRSMASFPLVDHETSFVHRTGFDARKVDTAEKLYHGLSPGGGSVVHYRESLHPTCTRFRSGYGNHVYRPQLPSGIRMKKRKYPLHGPISAISFPFTHSDLEGFVQSPRLGSPVVNRSPLSIRGNSRPLHHSCVILGANDWEASPATSTQRVPLVSPPEGFQIRSIRRPENPMMEERINIAIGSRVGAEYGRKAIRQPSVMPHVLFDTAIDFEEGSRFDSRKLTMPSESCPAAKESDVLHSDGYRCDHNERGCSWTNPKGHYAARSELIERSDGARHVDKACHHIDQSSSSSTNSNIPLVASSFMFSESK